jgi:hypothetical protein
MIWAMMRATGTIAATMPVMTPAKGMAGMPAWRGRGLLAEEAVAAAVAAATGAAAAAYCRGHSLFIVKIFFVW